MIRWWSLTKQYTPNLCWVSPDSLYVEFGQHWAKGPCIELFSNRRWRLDRPKQKAAVFILNLKKIMQHMHGIIPKLFDCWTDPDVHLLLPKNSKVYDLAFTK